MNSYSDQFANGLPSQFGGTLLEQFVTEPLTKKIDVAIADLDTAIQNALDKIVDESGGVTY